MSLSPRQQKTYRRLIKEAWEAVCRREGWPVKDKVAQDKWYRETLVREAGFYTSKQIHAPRDFRRVCAMFEVIAGNSIYWQMQHYRGDANEILHSLGELAQEHRIDEEYLRRIARTALQLDELPELHTLPADLLLRVKVAAKIHLSRREDRGDDAIEYEPVGTMEEQPF